MGSELAALAEGIVRGEARAIARGISRADDGDAGELLKLLYGKGGRAHVVGITGPPGAGKSTLVDRLTRSLREAGKTVGVVAVDPTSPFTGGAILGDRIRMQDLAGDSGVFVRSLATRGVLGGLSRATYDAVEILDAAGKDVILVETVGVGQDEVEVALVADTCVVVFVPGLGDEIQALKAGIIEIGDLFVINKADRPGAERTRRELHSMLGLTAAPGERIPDILLTSAERGEGIAELQTAVADHRRRQEEAPADSPESLSGRRRRRIKERLRSVVMDRLGRRVESQFLALVSDAQVEAIRTRKTDPYTVAEQIIEAGFSC